MKDDENIKLLGKIFSIVFIIIFLIIIISLAKYLFSFNAYDYEIPTTTTKYIETGYSDLAYNDKLTYNKEYVDPNFLKSLNNAISDKLDYYDVDLFQSEDSKFKYVYTYYTLTEKPEHITFTDINKYSQEIFNTELYENNFTSYKNTNGYYIYTVNDSQPSFCLKATEEKTSGDSITIKADMVSYDDLVCNYGYIDYSSDKVLKTVKITYLINDDNKYITSFIITK